MKMSIVPVIKKFLPLAFACTSLPLAVAQEYPARAVRVVVPFSPGGGADSVARVISAKLAETMNQQFVVENKPGATGIVGHDFVAKSAPDGYTLLIGNNSTYVIAIALGMKLPYNPSNDLTPIIRLGSVPHVITVHPSIPVTTAKELVAYAKERPDKLAFSSAGTGSTPHIAGEMFRHHTGVSLIHVPYKGSGQSVQDAIAGVIHVAFDTVPTIQAHIRGGRLRPIAIMGPNRVSLLPDVPTVAEAGIPGAEGLTWYALYAPGGLPESIINRLHAETLKVLRMPDIRERMGKMGMVDEPSSETPRQLSESVAQEISKVSTVVKAAGIRAE